MLVEQAEGEAEVVEERVVLALFQSPLRLELELFWRAGGSQELLCLRLW